MFSVGDSPGPGLETPDLRQFFSNLSWGPQLLHICMSSSQVTPSSSIADSTNELMLN